MYKINLRLIHDSVLNSNMWYDSREIDSDFIPGIL